METSANRVFKILSDQIQDVKKVVDINQNTGSPKCPLCKNDLGLSKDTYVVCKNPNCAFFRDFWYLFKFFNELVEKSR